MERLFAVLSLAGLLLMVGCGLTGPGARITSVKYVETIPTEGSVYYSFEGKRIIKMVLSFRFDDTLAAGLDPKSDESSKTLYAELVKGAHFYHGNEVIEPTYGFWPKKFGKNFATDMSLFYVIPSNPPAGSLRFVFDTSLLGKGASALDTVIRPTK